MPAEQATNAKACRDTSMGSVLIEWSLRREAPRWRPRLARLAVLIPVILAWGFPAFLWSRFQRTGLGPEAHREVLLMAALTIFIGGAQFASKAICWEISAEMRELVRLTGVNLRMLLWVSTLSRWCTIAWSVALLLPLSTLAYSFGGVTYHHLAAGLCGLGLLWCLICGFGMLANVITSDTRNPERGASNLTVGGLIFYNVSFLAVSQAIYVTSWWLTGNVSPAIDYLCKRISYSAPAVSLWNSLVYPDLFNAIDPGYWGHFLTAVACMSIATGVVEKRFAKSNDKSLAKTSRVRRIERRSTSGSGTSGDVAPDESHDDYGSRHDELVPEFTAKHPRCTDHPHFWKDVYVLSDERKFNLWTAFYVAAAVLVLLLSVWPQNDRDHIGNFVMLIFSMAVAASLVSIRFDALLTAEFRDRTWGTLMLLPVDPRDLLEAKLQAAFWEQRYAALPLGMASLFLVAYAGLTGLQVVVMSLVICAIACGLLCQISCINQLLGKRWWLGPCQAIGFIGLLILSSVIWSLAGIRLGFVMTVVLLVATLAILQSQCVTPLARNWVEP